MSDLEENVNYLKQVVKELDELYKEHFSELVYDAEFIVLDYKDEGDVPNVIQEQIKEINEKLKWFSMEIVLP